MKASTNLTFKYIFDIEKYIANKISKLERAIPRSQSELQQENRKVNYWKKYIFSYWKELCYSLQSRIITVLFFYFINGSQFPFPKRQYLTVSKALRGVYFRHSLSWFQPLFLSGEILGLFQQISLVYFALQGEDFRWEIFQYVSVCCVL